MDLIIQLGVNEKTKLYVNAIFLSYVLPSPGLIPSLFAADRTTGSGGRRGSLSSARKIFSKSTGSYS